MGLSVSVMAHPRRAAWANDLARHLGGVPVVWDRQNDRWETGRRSLLAFEASADHHLVVQDDAILCKDFLPAVERAAAAAGEHPIGLYVGRVRPHQTTITPAVELALRKSAPWLSGYGPFWGVAIVIPTAHILDLVRWGDEHPSIPNYDRRIEAWYTARRVDCWYTVPSLADHRSVQENPSLIAGRNGDRQAHVFCGDRSALEIDWSLPPIPIPGGSMNATTHTLLSEPGRKPIAKYDLIAYAFNGQRRRVRGGHAVPIGLRVQPEDVIVDAKARRASPPDSVQVSPAMRGAWSPDDTAAKLAAEVERRGLEVTGSGSGGNVVKSDLVAALEADDRG